MDYLWEKIKIKNKTEINQMPQVHAAARRQLKKQRRTLSPCLRYLNSPRVQHTVMPAPGIFPYSTPKPLWPLTCGIKLHNSESYKAGMFIAAPGARGIAPPNLHTQSRSMHPFITKLI